MIYLYIAKEVWDIIDKIYLKIMDATQIYDLTVKMWIKSVNEYSNILKFVIGTGLIP